MSLKQRGFTILEVMIAVSLLAVTAIVFATLFSNQAKQNKSVKTVGIRDLGYYQVGRYAGDPAALALSFANANAGATGTKISPCYRTCLDPLAPAAGCGSGSSSSNRCPSHDGATPRSQYWYPLSVFNPLDFTQISGPNSREAGANPDTKKPLRYTVAGERCSDPALPERLCPVRALTYFNPVCPWLFKECYQASSVVVKYQFEWSTDTSVDRSQVAAFKNLTSQIEVPVCQIKGFSQCRSFYSNPTSSDTSTGTGTGTGPGTQAVTSTYTGCSAICFLAGTMIKSEHGELPIELIEVGMKVWSMNPQGVAELNRVSRTFVNDAKNYLEVTFSNGRRVEVTDLHPYWDPISQDYKPIYLFKPGDAVMSLEIDNNAPGAYGLTQIRSIRRVFQSATVYNFEIENNHNYFSEGILVHNSSMMCVDVP